jgi:hypothetical protein
MNYKEQPKKSHKMAEINTKLREENIKLKKAIKILKEELGIGVYVFTVGEKYDYTVEGVLSSRIYKEQYDFLKGVLEDEES